MKIIAKSYILVGILIALGAINLFLLYEIQQGTTNISNSIIKAGELNVKAENIASLTNSIASGEEDDRVILQKAISDYDSTLQALRQGGTIDGQVVAAIPSSLVMDYNEMEQAWKEYKSSAETIQQTQVFNDDSVRALNYILEKNGELVLLTDSVNRELNGLDRDYKRHQEIATELSEVAKNIGQTTLLISINEETTDEGVPVHEQLEIDRIKMESGVRKLLGHPTTGLDLQKIGETPESIIDIPRENSNALNELDPLWEAVNLRVTTLQSQPLHSSEFSNARINLLETKAEVIDATEDLLTDWNMQISKSTNQEEGILQVLLGVNIAVFVIVIIVIRQSLNPLELITQALSKVKEGQYGAKIEYTGQDEVGELVSNFNIMSDTIKEKEEEARQQTISKDEFLAMITHELKTPLVPIQGYVDLLLNEHLGKLTEKQKERLEIIKTSSKSLLDIISDLLDAQKLELGQLRIKKENLNIKNTVEKATTAFMADAEKRQIQLTYQTPDLDVIHDPDRIDQVLGNLIKNSMNSVSDNIGVINIQVLDLGENIRVDVTDNGKGIPSDKQDDLFKKFYQVDASLTREKGGSGLGLAICKGIIEAHQGDLSVRSAENAGATFSFTIPKVSNAPSGSSAAI